MKRYVVWSLVSLAGAVYAAGPAAVAPPAFSLPALPYERNALEPYVSARTMDFHYDKHHRGYLDNLNKLVVGAPWARGKSLESVIRESAGTPDRTAIFNNAAQVWNHDFFWKSMRPGGGGQPSGRMMEMTQKSFGDFATFRKAFLAAAVGQFGSGWVWLVKDGDALKIVTTSNADTPLAHGQHALMACDVWEHAYYLDYQNRRKDFAQAFLDHLANWDFAASRLGR